MESMDYNPYFNAGSQSYNYLAFASDTAALYNTGESNEANGAVPVSSPQTNPLKVFAPRFRIRFCPRTTR